MKTIFPKLNRPLSRREFLTWGPIGVAGVAALGFLASRLVPSALSGRRQPPEFPEGSIFTPARDTFRRRT